MILRFIQCRLVMSYKFVIAMGNAADGNREEDKSYFNVGPGVWGSRILFANVYYIATPLAHQSRWVLVDAGLYGSAPRIIKAAEELFGKDVPPACIVLTHGHFDHVGALHALLEHWNVPVYAHSLELPYLDGRSSYPPPDPTVGGGLMSWMSFMYPKKPIDITQHLREIPVNGIIPGMDEWQCIHTPGHTPGHISLFRDIDRTLIAGDAFVTTKQESVLSVMRQTQIISGPPAYFTQDWEAARQSVERLAQLEPEIVASGHGMPMYGMYLRSGLHELADNFEESAVPASGRYVKHAAIANRAGTIYVPPREKRPVLRALAALALAAIAVLGFIGLRKRMQNV